MTAGTPGPAADDADEGRIDPALARLGSALADAGVRWAVLRGPVDAPGDGDLDLLVDPSDADPFASAARASGFPHLPAWGHGHHRFHLGRGRGGWWRLDVVTAFRFGGDVGLDEATVAATLERRGPGPVPRLQPDDAAWALVLHLLLDRDTRSDGDRRRLAEVAGAATTGPLADALAGALPSGWTPDRLRTALMTDDPAIPAIRRQVRGGLRRRDAEAPFARRQRRLRHWLAARLRKPLTAIYRSGPSVALMGPDGAGKSALIAGLIHAFPLPVRTAYLGLYPAAGPSTGGPKGLGFLRRVGMLWRRYLVARGQRLRGRLVVFDRHPLDARLPTRGRRRPIDRVRRFVLGHALPMPDAVFILDAPGVVLHARKDEFSVEELERDRQRYRALAARLPRASLVDATQPADVVLDDVVGRIWTVWATRLDPGPRR